jgi:signal transduction histidine kinase
MPTPRRTLIRLLRVWIVAVLVFGYGPAFSYGLFTWLLNEDQWGWMLLMYFTLVPVAGGLGVLALPLRWYRPIYRATETVTRGGLVTQPERVCVYLRAMQLPWQVARSAFLTTVVIYAVSAVVVYRQAELPRIELIKILPAIPLVGGMMAALCYFGTGRALQPVVAWCSQAIAQPLRVRPVPMAMKFLTTTCVLATAVLCLVLPAAFTLGQVVSEQHLKERVLSRLRVTVQRLLPFERLEDQLRILHTAALGARGYVFVADVEGRLASPHPSGYTQLGQERFYRLDEHLGEPEGAWVDRVGQHRVVAFIKPTSTPWMFVSIAYPVDFAAPLHHFLSWSLLVVIEVLAIVMVFGYYYTRGITTPLAELTRAAEQITQYGDLSQRVPVTTNDELSELARSFNRMVEQLQASKVELEEYTKRLEASAGELSSLNEEMEDLLRVVSHDLRAPLINVQGFSKRLEPLMEETARALDRVAAHSQTNGTREELETIKANLETRVTESLRYISKGVEKMDALLASLLAISRVGRKADPVRPNDLNEILGDVLATFHHQLEERAIKVIHHPLPKDVPCRRNEINQVFSNLVSNAINYMGPSEQRFIEIGATEHSDHLECFVRDTGVGVGLEDQDRIFQMFTRLQTVDVPGEGIGLAYVRKILRGHGGKVWVDSRRGQGSTFVFTLPRHHFAAAGRG